MTDAKTERAEDLEPGIDKLMTEEVSMEDEVSLEDELIAARAERDEMKDRFMRALADAENARKRGERDRREAENYGGSKLARDMLPVYDNMKRAWRHQAKLAKRTRLCWKVSS